MSTLTDTLDLGRLRLASGEGRRLELELHLEPFDFGEDRYAVEPEAIGVTLDLSRTTHEGYALRIRFSAALRGPCMRCLGDAAPVFAIDAREVDQPGGGEELESPYMADEELDLAAWVRDALALELPATLTCTPGCRGLCATCGVDLNQAGPDHHHAAAPDPRWAKLAELRFDQTG